MSLPRKLVWKNKMYDAWDLEGLDYRRMLYIFTLASGRTVKETAKQWHVTPSRVYAVRREFEKALKKIKPVKKITWPYVSPRLRNA